MAGPEILSNRYRQSSTGSEKLDRPRPCGASAGAEHGAIPEVHSVESVFDSPQRGGRRPHPRNVRAVQASAPTRPRLRGDSTASRAKCV